MKSLSNKGQGMSQFFSVLGIILLTIGVPLSVLYHVLAGIGLICIGLILNAIGIVIGLLAQLAGDVYALRCIEEVRFNKEAS